MAEDDPVDAAPGASEVAARAAGAAPAKRTRKAAPIGTTPLENYTVVELHRSKLVDAPYNPRVLSLKAQERLKAGIRKIGLLAPPVWNMRTGHIVAGHQRLSILDSLKGTADYTLHVAQVDLDELREKEANLLLNNPEAQGEWDLEKLEAVMHTEGIEVEATGFDTADVYRLFGDAPMSSADLDDLATRLQSAREAHEAVQAGATARDDEDFYFVVVFKDTEERDAFLTSCGMDDNRFQDGRKLRTLIDPTRVTLAPVEAKASARAAEQQMLDPDTDPLSKDTPRHLRLATRRELGKLREVARSLLEGLTCELCGKALLGATAFIGHEPGSGRGGALPEITDLAEHHRDGNHVNNAKDNRVLVHHLCHKRFHGDQVVAIG